jgi:hypothetical protein
VIVEVSSGNRRGIAGKPLTTADVLVLAASKPA